MNRPFETAWNLLKALPYQQMYENEVFLEPNEYREDLTHPMIRQNRLGTVNPVIHGILDRQMASNLPFPMQNHGQWGVRPDLKVDPSAQIQEVAEHPDPYPRTPTGAMDWKKIDGYTRARLAPPEIQVMALPDVYDVMAGNISEQQIAEEAAQQAEYERAAAAWAALPPEEQARRKALSLFRSRAHKWDR